MLMGDFSSVVPAVLGVIALGTLILGQLTKPAPVPVRARRPRR
ncbi:MAG: hypothetical protein AB1730_24500 [Myxococcota bacterium]|jgi:hypothetical protein